MDLSKLQLDEGFYREMNASMNIFDEVKFKKALIAIARRSAEVVGATMGPYANTVIIGDGYAHYPTKDGWSVLRQLSFNTPMYQELFGIFKEVSFTLASKVGDGTSTAVIAADAFINEMVAGKLSEKVSTYRQSDFVNTLDKLVDELSDILKKEAGKRAIDRDGDFSDIEKIAFISSNGNTEVSSVIKKIYQETKNPNIYVALGNSDHIEYEIETGFRLAGDTTAMKLYVNNDEGTYKPSRPCLFAIVDHRMNYGDHFNLIKMLNEISKSHKQPVVLICSGYDDVTAAALKAMFEPFSVGGGAPVITVFSAPTSMEYMRNSLSDFSMLAGATIIDSGRIRAINERLYLENGGQRDENTRPNESIYDTLDQFKDLSSWQLLEQCLGTNSNVIIGEKYIMIKDYNTDTDIYRTTVKEAKEDYLEKKLKVDKSATAYDTDYMRAYSRYNRLTGTMGTIKIGATSTVAQKCLKDSVDDAVLACRSAFENGYVKGLNVTTLRAIHELALKYSYHDIETDVLAILDHSIRAASIKVLENKYDDMNEDVAIVDMSTGEKIVCTPAEHLQNCINSDAVLDLLTDTMQDDEHLTVIQSVQTDIEVLKALSSILGLILTSSHMISTNQVYDRKDIELIQRDEQLELFNDKVEIVVGNVVTTLVKLLMPSLVNGINNDTEE